MKLRVKIYKNPETLINRVVYYDTVFAKGLYFVKNKSYIKRNVKALDIKYQVPNTETRLGVRLSKHDEFVVLTITLLFHNNIKINHQFIITKFCTAESIDDLNLEYPDEIVELLKKGVQMLSVTTLQDILDLEDNIEK